MTRPALLLALLALAAACAAPPPPRPPVIEPYFLEASDLDRLAEPGPLPDVQAVRSAFHRPIMASCDDLSCSYDLPRLFRVRALACEPRPPLGSNMAGAQCRYERQLVPMKGEPGPWHPAETLFYRSTDPSSPAREWRVQQDLRREP